MEDLEISKSTKIKIIMVMSLVFLLSLIGMTYAFFSISVEGNEEASSIIVETASLNLIYTDTLLMEGHDIYPGWYQSKEISVENTGTDKVYYNLIWKTLYNEIMGNELVMSATCSSNIGSCGNVDERQLSIQASEANNVMIKRDIEIQAGEKDTYIVTIRFDELGVSQDYNQGKNFRGTLNISEGTEPQEYLVTFNPDGGSVNTLSKEVTYGRKYGSLPEPQRDGYTFVCWNGKNMFDEDTLYRAINGSRKLGNYYVFTYVNAYRKYGNGNKMPITNFKESTQYTLTVFGRVSGSSGSNVYYYFGYGGSSTRLTFGPLTDQAISITSTSGNTVVSITMSYGSNRTANILHTQLEEGNHSTTFEPYCITSDTEVVQNNDHTLTAIWKENE